MPPRGLFALSAPRLAVVALLLCLYLPTASADDIKIMGLTATPQPLSDHPPALTYLLGSCQPQKGSLQCHLHQLAIHKPALTPLDEQAYAVLAQEPDDPQRMDTLAQRSGAFL